MGVWSRCYATRPEILRWPEWDSIRSIPYEIRHKEFKRVLDKLSKFKI